MSEGFTVDIGNGEIAGIVVRQRGERGFRFHAALSQFAAMDGHVFVSPLAAQRAALEFESGTRRSFKRAHRVGESVL